MLIDEHKRLYVVTCIAIAGLIATIVIEGMHRSIRIYNSTSYRLTVMILRILWHSNRQFWLSKRPTCHLCMRAFGFTVYTFVTLMYVIPSYSSASLIQYLDRMSLLITFRPEMDGPYVFVASRMSFLRNADSC